MPLPLRTLPIVELWDCHGCGDCCRGSIIPLDADDRARLAEQAWHEQPDFRGVRTVVSHGLGGGEYTLAQKPDGSCIFLTAAGRCRVHELFGFEAKPRACRMYPLQAVPVEGRIQVTVRRSCPSAARSHGRPLAEHLPAFEPVMRAKLATVGEIARPAIVPGLRRDWHDTQRVADALARLTADTRYPLVRRLVHGVEFCALLAECPRRKLRSLDAKALGELVDVLENASRENAGRWFADRQPPSGAAMMLFRQTAGDIVRLHPRRVMRRSWRARLGLGWATFKLARGSGLVPGLMPGAGPTKFEALERPLGALPTEITQPLDDYFASFALSLRYATLGYARWSLVEGFANLALQYPVALWLLRWASETSNQKSTADELIPIICCLDRAHGYTPLTGWRQRRRVSILTGTSELQRLITWYAR